MIVHFYDRKGIICSRDMINVPRIGERVQLVKDYGEHLVGDVTYRMSVNEVDIEFERGYAIDDEEREILRCTS